MTLKGFVTGKQIHVHCPYCNRFHHHGWSSGSNKRGELRGSHCDDNTDSPYKAGYLIAPFSAKELKEIGLNIDRKTQVARKRCSPKNGNDLAP